MSNSYSGLLRQRVVAKAYKVTEVEFFEAIKPNYFRVTNNGTGRLFFACRNIPTAVNHDFVCDGSSVALWCEPHERNRLFIFNPTGVDMAVDVMSFYAAFDPLALAFSALKLDFSGTTIETSTSIAAFNSPLPKGNNVIGKVLISEPDYFTETQSDTATDTGVTFGTVDGYIIYNLCFMSNDGEADLTLTIVDYVDDATHNIVLRSGEVLNDIKCKAKQFRVYGSNVPFRMVYNLREA